MPILGKMGGGLLRWLGVKKCWANSSWQVCMGVSEEASLLLTLDKTTQLCVCSACTYKLPDYQAITHIFQPSLPLFRGA